MTSAFDRAFARTIGHEGGYVDDPRDPGGRTKFGISQRAYPHEDIASMTVERAKLIYVRDYWQSCRCQDMPDVVAAEVFDAAVNCGTAQAKRWVQRAAGVADDGVIGPITIDAIRADPDPSALAARVLGHRLAFHADLSTWPTFGRGWARRIAANLKGMR